MIIYTFWYLVEILKWKKFTHPCWENGRFLWCEKWNQGTSSQIFLNVKLFFYRKIKRSCRPHFLKHLLTSFHHHFFSINHLCLPIYSHSSLQKHFRSIKPFSQGVSWTQPASGHLADFSVGLRSGFWLGHSETSVFFFWWSLSFVALDVCCGSTFSMKHSLLADIWRFCTKIFIKASVLAEGNDATMLHRGCGVLLGFFFAPNKPFGIIELFIFCGNTLFRT